MVTKLTSKCQPIDGGSASPAACRATFTVDGLRGNQKLLAGGILTLCADDACAESYLWDVAANPPTCDYLLTGAAQREARLSLPGPGAFVVQLTVMRGSCTAQTRSILWVATTCQLYRLPAASEPLRVDGDADWAGDLSKVIQQVDCNLPTADQKAAMDHAHDPSQDNPFATLHDLPGGPNDPGHALTDDEIAAIRQGQEPSAKNPFITQSDLPPPQLTPEQEAAVDQAESPGAENPFMTRSALPDPQLTEDQEAAVDAAENPSAANPFITHSALPPPLTEDQKAALDQARAPGASNPLATVSHVQDLLPSPQLTPAQAAAVDQAQAPSGENPFTTVSRVRELLPNPELTPAQKAAIEAAENPNGDNPFVTESRLPPPLTDGQRGALDGAIDPGTENVLTTVRHVEDLLPEPQLSPEQEAALNAAANPNADNPFITASALPPPLTDDQRAAIGAAEAPNAANPFTTLSHVREMLPEPELTPEQRAAVDQADNPSAANPFVTRNALPALQLTEDQEAAIDAAQAPRGDNPFLTQSALPLASDQIDAIAGANRPSAANPFATRNDLPLPQLTPDQEAAIDAALNPSRDNPLITRDSLPATQLTAAQMDAITAAQEPDGANPFVTQRALPPVQLTAAQEAAMDAANRPSADNPVATLADVGKAGTVTRVVAAGTLDLGGETTSKTLGGLQVVARQSELGVATLAFDTYRANRQDYYVVKALPISSDARAGIQALTVVQLVEFTPHGFVMQMVRPFAAVQYALGPCMIEVSEIIDEIIDVPDVDKLLDEDFSDVPVGHSPSNWIDTGENHSLEPSTEDLFKIAEIRGGRAFGTSETKVDIHSHYNGAGASEWTNYVFTGQLLFTNRRSGIGVTFFSHYTQEPGEDAYYRLRRSQRARRFHLASRTATISDDGEGKALSHEPQTDIWYWFCIEVEHDPEHPQGHDNQGATAIRAKMWEDRTDEPESFEIDVLDVSRPIKFGTVGLWSSGPGGKYFRHLTVCRLPSSPKQVPRTSRTLLSLPIQQAVRDYYSLIQQAQYADAWLMMSDRLKASLGVVTLEQYRREWQRSGPAFVVDIEDVNVEENHAELILELNYPNAVEAARTKRFRYQFERDEQAGSNRFGHWLFMSGQEIPSYSGLQMNR